MVYFQPGGVARERPAAHLVHADLLPAALAPRAVVRLARLGPERLRVAAHVRLHLVVPAARERGGRVGNPIAL